MTDAPTDVSGVVFDISGMDVSGVVFDVSSYTFQAAPPVPTILRLDDILSHTTVLLQKEAADAAALAAIGNPDINELNQQTQSLPTQQDVCAVR